MDALKILVVDDESRMRKLVKDFLVKKNFEVLEAADGEEAIDLFYSDKNIALIILDVMMPRMDGWEVCREIRKNSKVPIIMLTARAMSGMNCWDLNWEWMSISPSPSVRRFWWPGWRRFCAEPVRAVWRMCSAREASWWIKPPIR